MLMRTRFTKMLGDNGRYDAVKLYLMKRRLRGIPREISRGIYTAFRFPFDEYLSITIEWKPYTLHVLKFLKEQLKYHQFYAHKEHLSLIRNGKGETNTEHLEACWKIQQMIERIINEI